MFDGVYRRRLEGDIAGWLADGLITASAAEAIRKRVPAPTQVVTPTVVVAIAGGLLIAASFLAFVAANWTEIARPLRLAIILAGLTCAYTLAAMFDRRVRRYLADLAVGVGTIIFGAGIALVGQMYHLGDDFAGAMLLWAAAALVAAALTGSRGAFAVALVAACVWNSMRATEIMEFYWPFAVFWLIAALFAVAWSTSVARHLVAAAAVAGWAAWAFALAIGASRSETLVFFVAGAGLSLLFGSGLVLAERGSQSLRTLGATLSNYAGLALAADLVLGFVLFSIDDRTPAKSMAIGSTWIVVACAATGFALASTAGILRRSAGPLLAALAMALLLGATSNIDLSWGINGRWAMYALALGSMLALVVSGILDECRPRVVAGWIGLAGVVIVITWAVRGSLLQRSVFLAAAGIFVIVLAILVGRLPRRVRTS